MEPVLIPNSTPTRFSTLMRLVSIDPSLRGTGFAILEQNGTAIRALEYGTIRNSAKLLPSGCLVAIHERVLDLLHRYEPECAVFEAVIYVQSYRTAITLGSARGAALLAAAGRGLPIYEYAPKRVRQSVVGHGGAEKSQVGFMVRALLGLTETPDPDAADAIAIGITHFQVLKSARQGLLEMEQI